MIRVALKLAPTVAREVEMTSAIEFNRKPPGSIHRAQAARRLGVSATTLLRWEREGYIPTPARTLGGCWYTEEMIAEVRQIMDARIRLINEANQQEEYEQQTDSE